MLIHLWTGAPLRTEFRLSVIRKIMYRGSLLLIEFFYFYGTREKSERKIRGWIINCQNTLVLKIQNIWPLDNYAFLSVLIWFLWIWILFFYIWICPKNRIEIFSFFKVPCLLEGLFSRENVTSIGTYQQVNAKTYITFIYYIITQTLIIYIFYMYLPCLTNWTWWAPMLFEAKLQY